MKQNFLFYYSIGAIDRLRLAQAVNRIRTRTVNELEIFDAIGDHSNLDG